MKCTTACALLAAVAVLAALPAESDASWSGCQYFNCTLRTPVRPSDIANFMEAFSTFNSHPCINCTYYGNIFHSQLHSA
ncbi:hypothetical protein MRX96_009151 [Rhipicephalus microplus]